MLQVFDLEALSDAAACALALSGSSLDIDDLPGAVQQLIEAERKTSAVRRAPAASIRHGRRAGSARRLRGSSSGEEEGSAEETKEAADTGPVAWVKQLQAAGDGVCGTVSGSATHCNKPNRAAWTKEMLQSEGASSVILGCWQGNSGSVSITGKDTASGYTSWVGDTPATSAQATGNEVAFLQLNITAFDIYRRLLNRESTCEVYCVCMRLSLAG